jgi:hypothetical protein
MPGPFVFLTKDWGNRDIALEESCWEYHIKRRRYWYDDRMLPLIRKTIEDADAAFESQQHSRRAEIWRHFDDVKDGQPGYVKVIVEYDALFVSAMSGDVRTAVTSTAIDSRGAQLWARP